MQIAQDKGFKLVEFNITEDHIHLLVWQDLNDSTNYVMRMFKGISSRRFFQEYPSNRLVDRKLWGRGYHARNISKEELPTIRGYIRDQIDHDGYDKRYKRNREAVPAGRRVHSRDLKTIKPAAERRGSIGGDREPRGLLAGPA